MKKALILILSFDLLALFYGASTLSIGANEARIYYDENNVLYYLTHAFTEIFGQNDYALRAPFILLHFCSCIMLYLLALKYTKKELDAFLSVLLFILLPGTLASALLVNHASLTIFISLIILCAYEYDKKWLFYTSLVLAFFIDSSFILLFLAFFFFGIYKKNPLLIASSLVLLALCLAHWGFDTRGRPRGYFLDTLGIFAACFSPLVFIYFSYVIYRLAFKRVKPLLWFVGATTLVFCLLASIRQKLFMDTFLPFCVICTPLLIQVLMASYRVRLPQFRLKYNILIECSLIFLCLCYLIIIFNPLVYLVLKNPDSHFVNNYHEAKDIARELKKLGITHIKTAPNLQIRLQFYGIQNSNTIFLQRIHDTNASKQADFEIKLFQHRKFYKVLR